MIDGVAIDVVAVDDETLVDNDALTVDDDTLVDALTDGFESPLKYKKTPLPAINKAMAENIAGTINPFCLFFILTLTTEIDIYYKIFWRRKLVNGTRASYLEVYPIRR